jgi:hypothetical protein
MQSENPIRSPAFERRVGLPDDILILQRQAVVIEQHADDTPDPCSVQAVDGIQHPAGFHEHEKGYPGTLGNECLRAVDLFRIVPHCQPDENVRVNCAHGCVACGSECPRPGPRRFGEPVGC